MDRILAVHAEDLDCVVEAGLRRIALNKHLRERAVFPIDPGANATIGGMAATGRSGTNAVRTERWRSRSLTRSVMADGSRSSAPGAVRENRLGRLRLTRLFVGSEGTLGIITEVTLRLHGHSRGISAGHLSVPELRSACRCDVVEAIQSGRAGGAVEYSTSCRCGRCNDWSKLSLPEPDSCFSSFTDAADVREQSETRQGDCKRDLAAARQPGRPARRANPPLAGAP